MGKAGTRRGTRRKCLFLDFSVKGGGRGRAREVGVRGKRKGIEGKEIKENHAER